MHAQLKMLIRVLLGIIKNQISFNMRQTKENRKLFLRLLYIIILSQCVIIIAFAAHQYHLSLQPYNTTENSMEQEMFEKIIELERNFTAIPDSLLKIVIQPLILYDSNKNETSKIEHGVETTDPVWEVFKLWKVENASGKRLQRISNIPYSPLLERKFSTRDLQEERFTGKFYNIRALSSRTDFSHCAFHIRE